MPIYEYRCAACGHTLEALQKFSDKPLRKCPECSKSSLKRLISAPSFRLKGGGWYETDFKRESDKKRNLVDGGEASAASKDAGKPDAKKSEGEAKSSSSNAKETPAKASSSSASSDSASG
jgi:putative FmdB family regulatory protein